MLKESAKLTTVSHFMQGFLQLSALGRRMTVIFMVFTVLAHVPKIDRGFDGPRPPEHWAPFDLHKDLLGTYTKMPSGPFVALPQSFVRLNTPVFNYSLIALLPEGSSPAHISVAWMKL